MGIPKFFGWLCERYPLLKDHLRDGPSVIEREFDAFYLDMNGIIHTCTHGDDLAFGEQLDEEKMFRRILQYTDRLVSLVRPRKVLYLAIDGVAPRAKLNQQRSRRFRAALEKNADRDKLIEMGQLGSDESIFDSNCITPGTAFLARLGEVYKRWIAYKVENDPSWSQGPTVIFSGADSAGEGEHKIMDYIREQRDEPGYDPSMRHCFYGLDADLIMLGLVTHEKHVSLLRERPRFGRGQPQRSLWVGDRLRMGADDFLCLDLGVLRRSLALPKSVRATLPFEAEERRLVDDFVLICMLVGNDFLPGLPHLDVAEGALNMMLNCYYRLLPELGGYLTDGSELHLARFERYLRQLGAFEEAHFAVRAKKEPWVDDLPRYQDAYYRTKFGLAEGDTGARRQAVADYMRGLQWCLQYYHDGCCSWTWCACARHAVAAAPREGGRAWAPPLAPWTHARVTRHSAPDRHAPRAPVVPRLGGGSRRARARHAGTTRTFTRRSCRTWWGSSPSRSPSRWASRSRRSCSCSPYCRPSRSSCCHSRTKRS